MSDFAGAGDLITGLAGAGNGTGCRQFGIKASQTTVANFFYSSWLATGTNGPGVAPTSWAIPTQATAGSWASSLVDETGGSTNRMLQTVFNFANVANFILGDRLGHMAGLSGTSVASQTVGSSLSTQATAGRCSATGSDVMWFLEWYAATGSTAVTATIGYHDQSGTTGTTTVSLPASVPAGRMYPINVLAAGDTSIQSVDSVTLSASTLTAGNFGVTAIKNLAYIFNPTANNTPINDWASLAMPLVAPGCCLFGYQWTTTTSSGQIIYQIVVGNH